MDIRTVKVKMWGTTIGYLHRQDNGLIGFQYDEKFIPSKKIYQAGSEGYF